MGKQTGPAAPGGRDRAREVAVAFWPYSSANLSTAKLPDPPKELRPNLQLRDLVSHGVPSSGQANTPPGQSSQSYVDTSS